MAVSNTDAKAVAVTSATAQSVKHRVGAEADAAQSRFVTHRDLSASVMERDTMPHMCAIAAESVVSPTLLLFDLEAAFPLVARLLIAAVRAEAFPPGLVRAVEAPYADIGLLCQGPRLFGRSAQPRRGWRRGAQRAGQCLIDPALRGVRASLRRRGAVMAHTHVQMTLRSRFARRASREACLRSSRLLGRSTDCACTRGQGVGSHAQRGRVAGGAVARAALGVRAGMERLRDRADRGLPGCAARPHGGGLNMGRSSGQVAHVGRRVGAHADADRQRVLQVLYTAGMHRTSVTRCAGHCASKAAQYSSAGSGPRRVAASRSTRTRRPRAQRSLRGAHEAYARTSLADVVRTPRAENGAVVADPRRACRSPACRGSRWPPQSHIAASGARCSRAMQATLTATCEVLMRAALEEVAPRWVRSMVQRRLARLVLGDVPAPE